MLDWTLIKVDAGQIEVSMTRKGCIVLDLDESMVRTSIKSNGYDSLSDTASERAYKLYLSDGVMWGLKRPYLEVFLDCCFSNFEVGVWSAGDDEYVAALAEQLFVKKKHVPLFVWGRSKCFRLKGEYYKPLDRVFDEFPHIDKHNTVIIDDRANIARYNEDHHIQIPSYEPPPGKADMPDRALLLLVRFLKRAKKEKKPFTQLDKENIFMLGNSDENT